METCLKTTVSGLASWQLDRHPARLVTDIRSLSDWKNYGATTNQSSIMEMELGWDEAAFANILTGAKQHEKQIQ